VSDNQIANKVACKNPLKKQDSLKNKLEKDHFRFENPTMEMIFFELLLIILIK